MDFLLEEVDLFSKILRPRYTWSYGWNVRLLQINRPIFSFQKSNSRGDWPVNFQLIGKCVPISARSLRSADDWPVNFQKWITPFVTLRILRRKDPSERYRLLEVDRPISAHIISGECLEVAVESSEPFDQTLEGFRVGGFGVVSPECLHLGGKRVQVRGNGAARRALVRGLRAQG